MKNIKGFLLDEIVLIPLCFGVLGGLLIGFLFPEPSMLFQSRIITGVLSGFAISFLFTVTFIVGKGIIEGNGGR